MRLVVCSENKDVYPAFETMQVYSWITLVGCVSSAEELVELMRENLVDVAVSGINWMTEWEQAQITAERHSVQLPTWTVAGFYVTGAMCLECAIRPVADLIDLREGFDSAADRLLLAAKGFTAKDSNEIVPSRWTRNHGYVNTAVKDEFDLQIMLGLLQGETNTEIASRVHLSYQTVNNRISQMIHRTGSNNRTRLAMKFHDPHVVHTRSPLLTPAV